MGNGHNHCHYLLQFLLHPSSVYFLLVLVNLVPNSEALTIPKAPQSSVTAVLVFGDSTVDAGNNNYVETPFKGNFPPYGQDFVNHQATGRFSNGRLTTDFIASYVGVKDSVPPYLDPTLSVEDLMTGVSFASAGTGFDPLTPQISNVIDMRKQIEYFKEYKKKLESAIGKQKTEEHINKALVVLSAGTNDFVISYFTMPIRRNQYTVAQYQQFVVQMASQFLQDLFDLGARRIMVSGLSPMGCLPVVLTLFSSSTNTFSERKCLDHYSTIGKQFNLLLEAEINSMQARLASRGARIYLSDTYGPLNNMIRGPGRSAFDKVDSGCCGTGYLEAGMMCNPETYVCPDASKYVFWDAIHPTQQAYYNVFKTARPLIDLLIKD